MDLEYLYNDTTLLRKIYNDINLYERLHIASEIVKNLNITNITDFYRHALYLDQLRDITFGDVQAFNRFQNKEYFNLVKKQIKDNIIRFKK